MKFLYFALPLVVIQIICMIVDIVYPTEPIFMLPSIVIWTIFGFICGMIVERFGIDD